MINPVTGLDEFFEFARSLVASANWPSAPLAEADGACSAVLRECVACDEF